MEYMIKESIAEFDCLREYPPEAYFQNGDVKVVSTPVGAYREAEAVPLSRFGYRFNIKNVGKPHLALITYPDDKRRYMCVMDGTSYDLTTGVVTGFAFPMTDRMLTIEQVFWPRWNDCDIIFMTWGQGEPAAVRSIRIYELEDLPALEVPENIEDGDFREIGIQYEDPCGTGASEGAMNRDEWLSHVIQYSRFTGQRLFAYPINWYHGPQFPSNTQPADGFDLVVGHDRKQYTRWTMKPADWYADMLKRFEKEGMKYLAVLTLLRLGTLMKDMNIDTDAIKSGADTYNNMLYNDMVQSSPKDWTVIYNVTNFDAEVQHFKDGGGVRKYPWAYGERADRNLPAAPMFNPLHPVVQKTILEYVSEIAHRYGKYKSFEGLAFNIWHATILWFGSIRSGYDDYTVNLFTQETGVAVPADAAAPDRFSKRYNHIMFYCLNAWKEWRCRKIYEFICMIRDEIRKHNPKLKLVLTLFYETSIGMVLGAVGPNHQIFERDSGFEFFRNGGLDISLFENEPGIEVDLQLETQRDRGWNSDGATTPIEKTCSFRDHDFFDDDTNGHMKKISRTGAFLFNSWVEAWGKHTWFDCDPDDEQAKKLNFMDGKPADGIFRINSEYPKDDFWWDSQLRITPAFPAGDHFMEQYAHAVAEHDALRITRGGLFLDKAHSSQISEFAKAYRTIPAVRFENFGTTSDPVVIRKAVYDGKLYFYVINREYFPVTVKLTVKPGRTVSVTDLVKSKTVHVSGECEYNLGPYALKSLTAIADDAITDFEAVSPADIVSGIEIKAREVMAAIDAVDKKGLFIPGMFRFKDIIAEALAHKKYSRLRHAATSFIGLKSVEVARNAERPD